MKHIHIKILLGTILALFLTSCSDILEEEPRSIFTPEFFKTEKGVDGGLTSLYAHLRYIYGYMYYYNACQTGTDEVTYGQSATESFFDMDISGVGSVNAESCPTSQLWDYAFPAINTACGIIENAEEVGLSAELIAEARFFRAFDYFMLVQTFGGVPLDLGSGELKFNTQPVRTSTRNTVPEVYTKGILPDLITAANDLPHNPRETGAVTKTLARLYLAKAYLTYGWWLENPNSIPTYPECSRTDPDGHDAQWYFQQAYDVAAEAIDDPGPFGLESTYYDVHLGSNDRNDEMLLYADHTEASEYYNASSLTYSDASAPQNCAVWTMTWNYTVIRSSGISTVQREAVQHLGRPWIRMCPTIGVITNTFADKTYDSRYDGTFVSVYRGNWDVAGVSDATIVNANGMAVSPGDAILTFLDEDDPSIVYNVDNADIGAGVLPGRSDFVIGPSGISRMVFPGLWKLGTYRTDNDGGLGQPNAGSTRPFNIAKFSELYFVAAEAAVKGATAEAGKSARELINVIRARAGVWRWDNGENSVKEEDYSSEMTTATPTTIDINYILAERSREYFGEGYRWYDLVRTQKWEELASTYQICGDEYGDHTPLTIERDIQPYLYLRPIPQSQLDALLISEEEKDAYQNPGY